MIRKENITELAEEGIKGTGKFLVEVQVLPGNKIEVELDSPQGINVSDCKELHRFIEENLDREVEDYELTVSSPGLDKPFRVKEQYQKNTGRLVEVILQSGDKVEGKLLAVGAQEVELETKTKEKTEGKKSKQEIVRVHKIPFGNIKQTKVIISFK